MKSGITLTLPCGVFLISRVGLSWTLLRQFQSRSLQFARELGSRGGIGSAEFLGDFSPFKSCVAKLVHLTASRAQLASGFLGIQPAVFLGRAGSSRRSL
jgi:hypothetical protein